jgi:hypothetical protein
VIVYIHIAKDNRLGATVWIHLCFTPEHGHALRQEEVNTNHLLEEQK